MLDWPSQFHSNNKKYYKGKYKQGTHSCMIDRIKRINPKEQNTPRIINGE